MLIIFVMLSSCMLSTGYLWDITLLILLKPLPGCYTKKMTNGRSGVSKEIEKASDYVDNQRLFLIFLSNSAVRTGLHR